VAVDRRTGVVKATAVRLDREGVCPATSNSNDSSPLQECVIDISVGLVHSLQLEQVTTLTV